MAEAADTAAVFFANDTFYLSFQTSDAETMDGIWSRQDGVSCLHPGWPPLLGRELVMKSWRAILSNVQQEPVAPHGASVEVYGDTAVLICYETVGGTTLAATNIFIREGDGWKLVHHQSGPTQAPPQPAPSRSRRQTLQ